MSSVSFIVPSWHYYTDPLKHQPYWELYYATQLKLKDINVDIIDLRSTKKNNLIEAVDEIPERDFYFYWIFKTGDAKELYSVSELLRKKYPNSIHAAGGTHVDMCQTECKEYFNSIIVGPAEESFLKIINDADQKLLLDVYSEDYKSIPFAHTHFPDRAFLPKDIIVNNNDIVFIETNTLPGLSKASFIPQQLVAAKLSMEEFVKTQIKQANHST